MIHLCTNGKVTNCCAMPIQDLPWGDTLTTDEKYMECNKDMPPPIIQVSNPGGSEYVKGHYAVASWQKPFDPFTNLRDAIAHLSAHELHRFAEYIEQHSYEQCCGIDVTSASAICEGLSKFATNGFPPEKE